MGRMDGRVEKGDGNMGWMGGWRRGMGIWDGWEYGMGGGKKMRRERGKLFAMYSNG